MSLIGNYSVFQKSAGRWMSGSSLSDIRSNYNKTSLHRNAFIGQGSVEGVTNTQAIPSGYIPHYAWVLPQIAGGMASRSLITGSSDITNVNLAGGLNAESTLNGEGIITSAEMQLILSAVATLAGIGGLSADIAGKLEATASLAGIGDVSGALGALASAVALIQASSDLTSDANASGTLSATISPFTELSPENLAIAVLTAALDEYNTTGTLAKTLKDIKALATASL
jgi:hypothetical protein